MKGAIGALIEVILFFFSAYTVRSYFGLYNIHDVAYYWLTFTILTGIWEFTYVTQKKLVVFMAKRLLDKNEHVWTKEYPVIMILPTYLAKVFYAEYGAYADREYMYLKDKWSIAIEGTHCCLCGLFSLLSMIASLYNNPTMFYICMAVAMGTQLMNSILYLSQYMIQTKDPNSINYDTEDFPCGVYMLSRPFMWINLFWSLMPSLIILSYLLN